MTTYLAARDWGHAQWQGDFYPHDLPQDWRLAYYSNEFQAVALPAELWVSAPTDQVQGWLVDTASHFRFYLLADEASLGTEAHRALVSLVEQLGGQCGGLVVFVERASRELIDALRAQLPASLKLALVCGVEPEAALCASLVNKGANAGLSLNWLDDRGRASSSGGALCVMVMPDTADPKALRACAETAQTWACDEQLMLFAGIPPRLEAMRAMGVILGLLG